MKKFTVLLAGAAALLGAQTTAHAATFSPTSGTYVFKSDPSAPVTVSKDLGAFGCDMEVTVTVNAGGVNGSVGVSLPSGSFVCPLIQITGSGTVTPFISGGREYVTISGLTITPPLSSGQCTGSITAEVFDATVSTSPTEIELTSPGSDSSATAGAPCKMVGKLYQTSPASPQLQVVP
jgi:hypothetical protein